MYVCMYLEALRLTRGYRTNPPTPCSPARRARDNPRGGGGPASTPTRGVSG